MHGAPGVPWTAKNPEGWEPAPQGFRGKPRAGQRSGFRASRVGGLRVNRVHSHRVDRVVGVWSWACRVRDVYGSVRVQVPNQPTGILCILKTSVSQFP